MAETESWRKILISSLIGAAGVLGVAGINAYEHQQTAIEQTRIEQASKRDAAQLERDKAEIDFRRSVCDGTYVYLEDEKPNLSISQDQRNAVAGVIVENLKSCAVRTKAGE